MSTLTERITDRPKRMPMPTARQMAAATEILERAQGKDARSQTLAPFVADGVVTLHERLDAAGLGEQVILAKLREKLDAEETQFFQKDGIVTDERNVVAHGVQLKATRTALELRGLLSSRGGVSVAASGNCQVNVGLSWSPPASVPQSLPQSNDAPTSTRLLSSPGPPTSTGEGTGNGRAAAAHSRSTAKSVATAMVTVPVSAMSVVQLKKYLGVEERKRELLRRKRARAKRNPRVRRSNKGESNCKSGKCGRCNKCRLERRRIGTGDDGRPVYAR